MATVCSDNLVAFSGYEIPPNNLLFSVFAGFVTVNIYTLFASKLFSPVCSGFIIAPLYLFISEN